jgi:hypothetical protein
MMKGWKQIDDEEMERRYNVAADLVASWADANNPDIQLGPMGSQIVGQEAQTIDILNVRTGLTGLGAKNKEIERLIPGAELDTEHLPNGKPRYMVNIPIWIQSKGERPRGNNLDVNHTNGKPSTEYLMFLIMVDAILATVLFFRTY